MSEEGNDQAVLEAKKTLRPVMERQVGRYECVLCGTRQEQDGNCPKDGLPLRRLAQSG